MSGPSSRDEFKKWCLRELGWPVLTVNVDEDQLDDRVEEALEFFREFHFDGTEEMVMKHQLTQTDKDNQYITIPDNVIGITKILPLAGINMSAGMFNIQYQMMLTAIPDFTNAGLANFYQSMQYLDLMNMILNGETLIRFNRNTNKLYLDYDWVQKAVVGDWILIVGYSVVDPDQYTKTWNDRMLKKLATAYIKKQWGTNMKKFQGMQLPGGVQMNGQTIYDEAINEISQIETEIETSFQLPNEMIVA